jgi:hypothetical protein
MGGDMPVIRWLTPCAAAMTFTGGFGVRGLVFADHLRHMPVIGGPRNEVPAHFSIPWSRRLLTAIDPAMRQGNAVRVKRAAFRCSGAVVRAASAGAKRPGRGAERTRGRLPA